MVLEGLLGFLEFVFLLGLNDGVLGGKAVAEGIEADGGLALGGFGSSAALGIAAIGFKLQFGGQDGARFLSKEIAP